MAGLWRGCNVKMLALDCGTHCGWAFGSKADSGWRLEESGVQVFDVRRGESPGLRFARFRSWLEEVGNLVEPAVVLFEQAHHRGGAATELCVGMTTRMMEWAASKGIEYAAVHSATLKKFATGRGNADKSEMIHRASEIAARVIEGDDEADAICLLAYGFRTYAPEERAA